MQVRKQQLELGMEQQTGSKLERSMSGLYIVTLLVLLIYRVHHEKCWAGGIKIAGRNINNLRYADNNTLTAETEEELKAS